MNQSIAGIRVLGTLVACLAFLPVCGHTEPNSTGLDQAQAGRLGHSLDLQQRHAFNIPSEGLNLALSDFSAQSGIHVLATGIPTGVLSSAVSGQLSTLKGLTALLRGTGMSYRQVDAQ